MQAKRYIKKLGTVMFVAVLVLAPASSSQAQFFKVLPPIRLTPSSCKEARHLTQSGIILTHAKHYSQAIQQFESALSVCPEDENTALDLIQTAVDVSDYPKAESTAKALLAHHPNSERAQIFLAYSYLMQRKFQDAGRMLQKVLAQDGGNPDALKLMGLTLFFYHDYVLAERELLDALAIRPHDENTLYALGRVYQTDNQFNSAVACFKRLIAQNPNYYRAYNNLALCYEAEAKMAEADAMFKTAEQVASRVDPSYDWAYANHANMLAKQGKTDEALRCIEKAVQINPRSARDQFLLGKVLLLKHDLSGAEKHLRMAVHLDDNLAKAHYLLGRIYRETNNPTKAQQEFAYFEKLSEKAHNPGLGLSDSER